MAMYLHIARRRRQLKMANEIGILYLKFTPEINYDFNSLERLRDCRQTALRYGVLYALLLPTW